MDKNEIKCGHCGKDIDDACIMVDGRIPCHLGCVHKEYNYHRSVMYSKCMICGNDVLSIGRKPTITICPNCMHKTVYCARCNRLVVKEETVKVYEFRYCPDCYDMGYGVVRDYCFTPKLNYYGATKTSDSLFLGIELEVAFDCYDNRKMVNTINRDYFYCKEDSSLPETGVEIVSHPMTFEFIKKNKNIIQDNILRMSDYGAESNKQRHCGLHIHMSKLAFCNYHLWKFLRFVYHKGNRNFIVAFSGRNKSELDRWAKISCYNSDNKARAKSKRQEDLDRHHAVNLARNDTVELRIFEGTLDKSRLWAYIEFTKALFEFTKPAKPKELTIASFIKFVKDDTKKRSRYKNCYKLLEKTEKALTKLAECATI